MQGVNVAAVRKKRKLCPCMPTITALQSQTLDGAAGSSMILVSKVKDLQIQLELLGDGLTRLLELIKIHS